MRVLPMDSAIGDRPINSLIGWMTKLSRQQAIAATIAMVAFIALADWLTGMEFGMGALYMLPVCFAAWTLGGGVGLVTGIVSALFSLSLNGPIGPFQIPGQTIGELAAAWNTAMRLLVVVMLVMLVGGFRRSFDEERRRGQIDPLTGAYNRSAFDTRIDTAIGIARRHDLALVFAYIDLDGFKQVNDTHGHAAGDEVLKTFSAAASGIIRQSDSLCRIGGDEFIVLMVTPSIARGYAAVEKLYDRLSRILETLPYDVTCSMGAAVIDRAGAIESQRCIALADALMYEVKRSGKNAYRVTQISGDRLRPGTGSAVPPRRGQLASFPAQSAA